MNSSGTGCLTIFIVVLVLVAAATGISACAGSLASQSNATNALRTQGFKDIHLRSRDIFFVPFLGCSREDVARFDYEATNPAGRRVTVSVCEGWPFKGATIRQP